MQKLFALSQQIYETLVTGHIVDRYFRSTFVKELVASGT